MKIIDLLFPNYKQIKQCTGEWDIRVISFFGDYNETKFCRFIILYSDCLKKYKLKVHGYKPKDHTLYDIYANSVSELNLNTKQL